MNKIVELVIDFENEPLDDLGVSIMSLVDEPAIGVNWMAFSQQHFVLPSAGESEGEFISRCIPVVKGEGYPDDQAAAICYSYWEEGFGLEDACWDGWEAIGLKPGKGGRMVPNCVPIEASRFEEGVPHYTADGKLYEGPTHKDASGRLMTGAVHTADSEYLYHADEFDINTGGLKPYVDEIDKEKFESYNDYPKAASANAQRALDWAEKNGWGSCGTPVGKQRANQLAKGENISEDTIARMASFERHRGNSKTPYGEGCGKLMWDAWGGDEGVAWAQRKLEQIRTEKLQKRILLEASKCGEEYDPSTAVYLDLNREEFLSVGEVLEGVQALDILSRSDIRRDAPAEIKYRYSGPTAERFFCRGMLALNKLYTREEIDEITRITNVLNPGMGHNSSTYSVWNYKGGVNCQHFWQELAVFRNSSGQLILVDRGPAAGNAGETAGPGNNFWRFSADDQMIVTGPAMIPNQLIPRRHKGADGKPGPLFHVYFSEETVRQIAKEFLARNMAHNTDVNHDDQVTNENTLLESWIIEDPERDKSAVLGYNGLPSGTWMVSYKINNPETWEKIKSGELRGFSVTGDFISKAQVSPYKASVEKGPRFGVVIPTHKISDGAAQTSRADFMSTPEVLRECLRSVAAQTFTDYKVYLVADCYEEDGEIMEVVKETIPADKISYYNLPEPGERNSGFTKEQFRYTAGCGAMNKGLEMAAEDGCEYIARIDHDDRWSPDHLELINKAYTKNPELAFVYTRSRKRVDANNSDKKYMFQPSEERHDKVEKIEPGNLGFTYGEASHSAVTWSMAKLGALRYRDAEQQSMSEPVNPLDKTKPADADMFGRFMDQLEKEEYMYIPKLTSFYRNRKGRFQKVTG